MKKNLNFLLIRAQNGDSIAYKEFLILSQDFLRLRIRKWISRQEIQDEIIQEALIGIDRNLHTFQPNLDAHAWIASIAHYKVIDFLRKNKNIHKEFSFDVTIEPVNTNNHLEMEEFYSDQLEELFVKLKKEQRDAIVKTKIEGLSTKEAASLLGIKENALRTQVSRGMRVLNEAMKMNKGDL